MMLGSRAATRCNPVSGGGGIIREIRVPEANNPSKAICKLGPHRGRDATHDDKKKTHRAWTDFIVFYMQGRPL
jgi:hypothetical protein